MKNKQQLLENWDEMGFINIPSFSFEEVEEMKSEAMKLLNDRDPNWDKHGIEGSQPFKHPHKKSKLFEKIMKDSRLVELVEMLIAHDNNVPECKIQATQTWIYYKPPGELGRDVHQNIFYTHCDWGNVINVSISLDDADEENGCLYFYPGSHKPKMTFPIPDSSHTELASRDVEREKTNPTEWQNERGKPCYVPGTWDTGKWTDTYEKIYVPYKAGSLTALDSHVLHGSDENKTKDRWRRSFLVGYIRESAHVNPGKDMNRKAISLYK